MVKAAAMRYLARREHAAGELGRKLALKGFRQGDINQALAELEHAGLLSNRRYAEARIRSRIEQGYGKLRINRELQEAGVGEDDIYQAWAEQPADWYRLMEQVRSKRFGEDLPTEYKEQMRQSRFLQYRGFPVEMIRDLLGS